ncbi:MAG: hypothetical protein IJW40_06860 [Clostridia bacterium]|nr:hypothetical protein [Clostridia bacterium]
MYEYVVSPAKQPIWRLKRVLAIIGYIAYALIFFIVGVVTQFLVPMMALIPLTTWILIWFTWRYVSVEYEYSFVSGIMTLTKILGGRTRKKVLEVRIKEMHVIAPYDGEYIKQAEAYKPEKTYDFTSSMQSPDLYFALFETADARRGIVYFEATKPALKILRYYNQGTVISEVRY